MDERLKTSLCPQNTPILWMNRSKSELSPQNRAFSWRNLPNTALSSSKHPLFVDESAFSSRLAVFSLFGVPLLEPSVMNSAVFPLELPSSSLWGLLVQISPGKLLICNHLIISIIAKSHLPGEAKLVSPGKHGISNTLKIK